MNHMVHGMSMMHAFTEFKSACLLAICVYSTGVLAMCE